MSSTQEKLDGMIFDIEDYVGGNIEGVANVDRMAFTAFLRKNLTALIDSAKREARGCIDCQKLRCEDCERLWQT